MNFKEAVDFLYSLINYERTGKKTEWNLEDFRAFLEKIGSPHEKVKNPILVAGTKGKGSVVAFLSSILSQKYKVGSYYSPHLVSIRERIKYQGVDISEKDFCKLVDKIKPYVTEKRTFFEALTAIAFLYFVDKKTDYNVIEVGLGGRLDATNVVNNKYSILTRIGFDHTRTLGTNLVSIAKEKVAILKPNGILICEPQAGIVKGVIRSACTKLNCEAIFVSKTEAGILDLNEKGAKFRYRGYEFEIKMTGLHQIVNALTAIKCAEAIGISYQDIQKGLKEAFIPGRFQVLKVRKKKVILDGAHNEDSFKALTQTLQELYGSKPKIYCVFAIMKDKDLHRILRLYGKTFYKVYATELDCPRARKSSEICEEFQQINVECEAIDNPIEAFERALKEASREDIVLVTGSFYLIGEVLKYIQNV